MSSEINGTFCESIHESNYKYPYHKKQVDAGSHISLLGRAHIPLNGDWQFGIDRYDTCLRQRWFEEVYNDDCGRPLPVDFDFDKWESIPVPSCWNLHRSGLLDSDMQLYEGSVVYTRVFSFHSRYGGYQRTGESPDSSDNAETNERVFLRFAAANTACYVFLNKQYLGMHTGGYTPFCFEVTDIVKTQNRLVVVVNNTRSEAGIPTDNTDWFNYGGIYRDVMLLRTPKAFIRDFFIRLVPDGSFGKIKASVTIDGECCIDDNKESCACVALLSIPGLGVNEQILVSDGSGEIVFEASPQLWNPDNPVLYDVTVTYGNDKITEKIGFRDISVQGGKILLNGEEIFLRGVCAHEESVPHGNALTEDEIRENFSIAKDLNCNFMRLAHYPHSEAAARIADEIGLLLWEEIPVYWAIAFNNNDTYNNAENQLSELIMRDRNRASVIVWSVGNENADTDERLSFMSRLADKARMLDDSRLVSSACLVDGHNLIINDRLAGKLDIIGVNEYYGWYDPDFTKLPRIFENSRPDKPVVITEFGADGKAGSGGSEGELYTEENQRAVYEKQIKVLSSIPYIKGICPWILYDFRCPRRLHSMHNYYNIKGLLSADKKHKKPAYYVMKKFYNT